VPSEHSVFLHLLHLSFDSHVSQLIGHAIKYYNIQYNYKIIIINKKFNL